MRNKLFLDCARYAGKKAVFGELLDLKEDHGGNTVIRMHPERLLTVEVTKDELTDVDTPKALDEIKKQMLSDRPI